MYVRIAEHLSQQGYRVFVSSHKAVQDELKDSKERVYVCCPSLDLKDVWIMKLKERYTQTKSDKDYRAWLNALEAYDESITGLLNAGFDVITIRNLSYILSDKIDSTVECRDNEKAYQVGYRDGYDAGCRDGYNTAIAETPTIGVNAPN